MANELSVQEQRGRYKELSAYFAKESVVKRIGAQISTKLLTPTTLSTVLLTAAQKNRMLLECSPESLLLELEKAAALGLAPNGIDAHLVPFRNRKFNRVDVVLIADWKGLVKLMYRSGMVQAVFAKAVRTKDHFEYRFGHGSRIVHEPFDAETLEGRGPLKASWALAELKGGGSPFVVLSRAEVGKAKSASRGSDSPSSPWNTHPDAMWAKSAVRQLAKFVPLTKEVADAVAQDERSEFSEDVIDIEAAAAPSLEYDGDDIPEQDPEPPKQTKTQRLAAKAAESKKTTPPPTKKPAPEPEPEPEDEPTDEADDVIDEPVQEEAVDEPASDEQPAEDTRNRKQIMDDFQREIYADNVEPDDVDALLEHHIIFNQHKLTDADRRWAKNLADTRKRELEDAAERPAKKGGRK